MSAFTSFSGFPVMPHGASAVKRGPTVYKMYIKYSQVFFAAVTYINHCFLKKHQVTMGESSSSSFPFSSPLRFLSVPPSCLSTPPLHFHFCTITSSTQIYAILLWVSSLSPVPFTPHPTLPLISAQNPAFRILQEFT